MRFVEEIDIYNNKTYLWFMQPPEKKDETAADLGWPNAFLGNEMNSIFVSAYNWQDLEQTDTVKCPPMAMCQYCYPVS